jgi:asparagine synthase (glutamine-hydrolysing)
MCGIVGLVGDTLAPEIATAMCGTIRHRGPDDHGEWRDPRGQVWLAQQRLAIIDLSQEGHQPMASASGRYITVYNGEIYNFQELRARLEGRGATFRGHSDTEVMLAGIEAWGLETALESFVGMFAFALFDRHEDCLYLVRDRMGVKPLYYAVSSQVIAFASELTPLTKLSWFDREIDRGALAAYFRYRVVPAPATIYRGASKLLPGHILKWSRGCFSEHRYWDLAKRAITRSQPDPPAATLQAAAAELDSLLRESIRLRMIADVPLGCFLSGGVDSSVVTGIMQSLSAEPIRTFSVGFAESSHDESRFAARVAQHLGTEHRQIRITSADALPLIQTTLSHADEPFADNSIVPTYAVAKFAREHVTVAMSGDGGDELFGGYPRYFWADRITATRRRLTPAGARLAAAGLNVIPSAMWNSVGNLLTRGRYSGSDGLGARVRRFGDYLRLDPAESFDRMRSAWQVGEPIVTGRDDARPDHWAKAYAGLEWSAQMMLADQLHYLPDDILTKVDRASMAVSLEAREPLLDHRIVEWSWRCPKEFKLARGGDRGKLVLREVLRKYVPEALFERPKTGFGLPMDAWLRNDLRAWADGLMGSDADWPEVIDRKLARQVWMRHLAGEELAPRVWPLLAFLGWYRAHA